MRKLLDKILGIEKQLSDVKKEIIHNIDSEEVSITMTKAERKYIKSCVLSFYRRRNIPINSIYGYKECVPYNKLAEIVDKF